MKRITQLLAAAATMKIPQNRRRKMIIRMLQKYAPRHPQANVTAYYLLTGHAPRALWD